MYSQPNVLLEISGKPAVSNYGFVAPAFFGRTTLQLSETRVIEKTRKLIATRYCETILSEIESAEIVEDGNTLLLVLGLFTIWLLVGIIPLILYFFIKYRFLIIRSGSNAHVLCITGSTGMDNARQFLAEVLKSAEKAKQDSHY